MIGKVLQNNNFKETTRYVLDKEKARLLDGTVMGHETDTISREFLMSRDLNPEIKRPVYHLIDSYSYQDAATKDLSDEFQRDRAIEHFAGLVVSAREPELLRREDKTEYKQKVKSFIETELYEYQWFCAAHEDTKHRHTHFVASRINLVDGRCIPTWQDQERSQRICREIEQEQGLQQLQSYYDIKRRSLTRGQREEWEKTGTPPVMVVMQNAIDQEINPGRSIEQVVTALKENYGIETIVETAKGKPGVVFLMEDSKGEVVRMSGSQLGRGYTYPAIQQRLEQDIEIEPPEVKSEIEQTIESDPLEAVLNEQAGYAERLVPQIKEVWERKALGREKLKVVSFEDYQIRGSEGGELELYRGDRLLLGYSEGQYHGYGLTQQDCAALERFQAIEQQLELERLRQLEAQQLELEQEKKRERGGDRDLER
jgi:hypothetical protein